MVALSITIVIISLFLVIVVLVQKSKGGGLAAGFQGSNQIMGAPKTADFLEKLSWSLMGIIAVLCIASSLMLSHSSQTTTSDSQLEEAPVQVDETAAPQMPEAAPEE